MKTKKDRTATVKRVWDGLAPRYDRGIALLERFLLGGGREWVGSRASGRVLEVAVGTGRNFPFYPAGTTVTGVELSPAMLALAKQRATDLGLDADLREADAQALPFDDGSFDTVVCTLSLCAIPDDATAITEMARVLRPGGRLLLLDHIGSSWWPIWAAQRLFEVVTARTAGEYLTRRPARMLAGAGLRIAESERLKLGIVERVHAYKPGA